MSDTLKNNSTLVADIIVVGAGTAGIPCAVEAARAGMRVLLLEKADDIGGTLHISGGHMSAAGARRQRERSIEDSPDRHFTDIMQISRETARADLVRLAVNSAAETLAWLEDAGFEHAPESPRIVYGHEPYSVARTYYGSQDGRSILAVLRRVLQPWLESGSIRLELGTRASNLIIENGKVSGVEIEKEGTKMPVRANTIVLATGGYAHNPDLFARLEKAPLVTAAWPTSTGDGLLMAEEIGATLAGHGTYLPTFGGLPPPDGSGRVKWSDRPLLTSERPPYEIYVDRRGLRWVAEDEASIDAKERALSSISEMTFWTIFDTRALRESYPMVVGWSREDLDARSNVQLGVSKGETLDELALRAGIDATGLRATVDRYNSFVAMGNDLDFGRSFLPAPLIEPPFYALENHGVTLITFVGVDIDDAFRVRRADGTVIEGLYAIGEVIGAGATSGNSFCGGMLVTPALTFGRLLGQQLGARRIQPFEHSSPSI
jgi:hypothetical protein